MRGSIALLSAALKRTQGFNNYECVENGVVMASWDGAASAGIAADDPLPEQPEEQVDVQNSAE